MPRQGDQAQLAIRDVQAAPLAYDVPNAQKVEPLAVNAVFDGTASLASWLPALEIISDSGLTVARMVASSPVAAGGSAEVTFAPFLRGATSAGLAFETTPQQGLWLELIATGSRPAGPASMLIEGTEDAGGTGPAVLIRGLGATNGEVRIDSDGSDGELLIGAFAVSGNPGISMETGTNKILISTGDGVLELATGNGALLLDTGTGDLRLVPGGELELGSTWQLTVGAAGAAAALPATPTSYLQFRDNAGNLLVIPAYARS